MVPPRGLGVSVITSAGMTSRVPTPSVALAAREFSAGLGDKRIGHHTGVHHVNQASSTLS